MRPSGVCARMSSRHSLCSITEDCKDALMTDPKETALTRIRLGAITPLHPGVRFARKPRVGSESMGGEHAANGPPDGTLVRPFGDPDAQAGGAIIGPLDFGTLDTGDGEEVVAQR